MSEIVEVRVEPLDLQLREPFEISLGVQKEASNILVVVETADGEVGYGEGSPLGPVTGENQRAALATAGEMAGFVENEPVEDFRRLIKDIRSTFPSAVSALVAVEVAILDAYCREREIALSELFGGSPTPVRTDKSIPILPPKQAADRAEQAAEAGFEHIKVKTGHDLASDIERVVRVAEVVPTASIKVDANQGWTPKETLRFANQIVDHGIRIELIEQPVPKEDLAGLAYVREHLETPIAADEAVFTPAEAFRVASEEAADIINVKLGKSGPLGTTDIAAIAQSANLKLMIGCMIESAVGIHTSAHVVSGLGTFSYIDLDGNRLLADDVVPTGDGPIHDIKGPGHGVEPEL